MTKKLLFLFLILLSTNSYSYTSYFGSTLEYNQERMDIMSNLIDIEKSFTMTQDKDADSEYVEACHESTTLDETFSQCIRARDLYNITATGVYNCNGSFITSPRSFINCLERNTTKFFEIE